MKTVWVQWNLSLICIGWVCCLWIVGGDVAALGEENKLDLPCFYDSDNKVLSQSASPSPLPFKKEGKNISKRSDAKTQVLLINSYHKGYVWSDELTRGVEECFKDQQIELHVEYLDSKRYFDPTYQQLMNDLMRWKHREHQYRLVITADNAALTYFKAFGREVFGEVPHVFCGVNCLTPEMLEGMRKFTGVNEKADFSGNIALIRKIHPQCRNIIVVSDTTPTGRSVINGLQRVKKRIGDIITLTPLYDVSLAELEETLKSVGPETVILYTFFFRDNQGRFLEYYEGARRVADASPVPVYCAWGFALGHGVVGGSVLEAYHQGNTAAEQALEILKGRSVETLPIIWSSPTTLQFDYRVLTRFHIALDQLPPGAEVLFQPTSFYSSHRPLIWKTVGVIALLALALMGTLYGLIKAKRAIVEMEKTRNERDKLNKQLLHAQKMEAIGTLAGGIAHDFNNMLSPMVGYSEMLMMTLPADSSEWQKVDKIFQAAMRAKDLVHQILTFSRRTDQEVKPIMLQPILKETIKLMRASLPSSISMETRIDAGCKRVIADATQIHQMVMNLATNAYHAMQESGGLLKISLDEMTLLPNTPEHPVLGGGQYGLIKIIDSGHGIPKEVIPKIFDPYFTTKEQGKGTGLGLSIVQGIVKNFGGNIQLFSEPGKGTEVHIYLPVIDDERGEEKSTSPESIPKGTEHILMVDDEDEIVEMVRLQLEELGYSVTGVLGSDAALKRFHHAPHEYDLLVTDMTMPGKNGLQLADAVKTIRPDIPILICTGFSDRIDTEELNRIGVGGDLMKPIVIKDLAVAVRNLLG